MSQNNIETVEIIAKPHIPEMQWERIDFLGGISSTNLSSFMFLLFIIILAFFSNRALKSKGKSKLRTFFLNIIKYSDEMIRASFWWDKKFSRIYFPLIMGLFIIILFWNFWGLIIDWLGLSINTNILYVLRPMHSDLNTTVAMALMVVVVFLTVGYKTHWAIWYTKSYLFNWKWNNIWEKCINVFVGWLHFIWIGSTIASLSLRLFGNIFAWIVLISIISYLGVLISNNIFEVGRLLVLPFWFFEIFIALIQALVFALLTVSYIGQSKQKH